MASSGQEALPLLPLERFIRLLISKSLKYFDIIITVFSDQCGDHNNNGEGSKQMKLKIVTQKFLYTAWQ